MEVERVDFNRSPSIGVFIFTTDEYTLVPPDTPGKLVNSIERVLKTEVIKVTIGGSKLIGVFVCGNSNGLLVPYFTTAEELEILRKHGINARRLISRYTALGNLILANDRGCLVTTKFSPLSLELKVIKEVLGVEVERVTLAGTTLVGSAGVATNRGCLLHPLATEDDLEKVKDVLNVKADVGTVNMGNPYPSSGLVVNTRGALVGSETTGPELMKIEQVFG